MKMKMKMKKKKKKKKKKKNTGHLFNNVFTTKELQPFGVICNVSPESLQFHIFYDKKTMIVSRVFWHSAKF